MKDVRPIISKNLAKLRKDKGLTQAELAERLNYSDKAVSRWEHGDTLPDVNVLYELCEFYGITLNDLTSEECYIEEAKQKKREIQEMKVWRCILAGSIIWLLATVVFMYMLAMDIGDNMWILFIIAAPISVLFFCIYGKGLLNNLTLFILSSCIMWLTLVAFYLSILVFLGFNFWHIFIVGVPVEVIIFLTFKMRGLPKLKEKMKK